MFIPGIEPLNENKNNISLWFVIKGDDILIKKSNEKLDVVRLKDISNIGIKTVRTQYLGNYFGENCFSVEASDKSIIDDELYSFIPIRRFLMSDVEENFKWLYGNALHIRNWDRDFQFCSRCGIKVNKSRTERSKVCPKCGLISFPRISPAIIVAVTKGDKLLLANNKKFSKDFYSVIAGFVDVGESLEECVIREVKEETNIEIKNINYFGNQTWPFSESLMIGFTADYANGELKPDGVEIEHVDWFDVDSLPKYFKGISISSKLIDDFIENKKRVLDIV